MSRSRASQEKFQAMPGTANYGEGASMSGNLGSPSTSGSRFGKAKQFIRELKEILEELDGLIIRLATVLFLLFAVAKLFAAH